MRYKQPVLLVKLLQKKADFGQLFFGGGFLKFFYFFSLCLFLLSYFVGISAVPWTGYTQDMLWFLGIIFVSILFKNKILSIPRIIIPILFITFIPLFQLITQQVYYFSIGFFSFCFLFIFFIAIVLAFSSTQLINKEVLILYCAIFFTIVSFVTSIFAIAQWLGVEYSLISPLHHRRSYANIHQPNNMATLLMVGICSLIILYERLKIRTDIFVLLLSCHVFAISLSQSRTVWVVLLVLSVFYFLQKQRFRQKWMHIILLCMTVGYFLIFYLNVYIVEYLYLVPAQSLAERLNTGYLRIEMWKHLLYAISQQPWLGYGWFQTNIAQLQGVLIFKNEGYLSSAHNIVLDLVLWVGIPIGLLILTYVLYLLKLLFINIKTLSDFYIFSLLICILVHANLEFPLYYSYFLFPTGFFIGLLLINLKTEVCYFTQYIKYFVFLCAISIYAIVFKQYDQWQSYLGYASGMENTGKFKNHKSILFSQFTAKEKFLVSQYEQKYTKNEINEFKHYVDSQPSYFNLFKFSQILYFNHDYSKSRYYFEISNALYNKKVNFEEIYKKRDIYNGRITISYLDSIQSKSNTKE